MIHNTNKYLRLRQNWLCFCYLCNDVSILSMHLCYSSQISDDTKHLINLWEYDTHWSAHEAATPQKSNDLVSIWCDRWLSRDPANTVHKPSIPESQKVGKHPYKPDRPGKSWHLKIENLWEKTAKGGTKRAKEGNPRAKEKSKVKRRKIAKQKY